MTAAPITDHQLRADTMEREPGQTLLKAENLTISFGDKTVVDGVDFELHTGELTVILGANGSGKSTTLRALAGLVGYESGSITIDGHSAGFQGHRSRLPKHDPKAAMIFQSFHLVGRRSVLDNVCAGALARMNTWQSLHPWFFPAEVRADAMVALDRVGLADRASEPAGKLSGGQQQRVAVARALCQGAKVLLADEPVSALDPQAAERIMKLLADLAGQEGLAVAAVLHQPDLAFRHADRLIGLRGGRIVLDKPAAEADLTDIHPLYEL